ncbi:hypothetical protein [Agrobacterium rosae]|uniref:Uncharacterized protein n=1 Tax=Agrobacterium rosae TaxID=1972867 RepID=A0A1R3U1X0_9HYPH|nr:hypothetical protein [Agrobacterium rosae]SCX35354.1 hypothetical protein DSM25559_4915 [Agrobacterium rosae]
MPVHTANVIDLTAYRQAQAKENQPSVAKFIPHSYAVQPVMMWMLYWGFVPIMMMGSTSHGA